MSNVSRIRNLPFRVSVQTLKIGLDKAMFLQPKELVLMPVRELKDSTKFTPEINSGQAF